jgi:hypothetical protein
MAHQSAAQRGFSTSVTYFGFIDLEHFRRNTNPLMTHRHEAFPGTDIYPAINPGLLSEGLLWGEKICINDRISSQARVGQAGRGGQKLCLRQGMRIIRVR